MHCTQKNPCALHEIVEALRHAQPDNRETQTRDQWFAMHDAALRRGDSWDSD